MDSYRFLAKYYDTFTQDVPYDAWVDFLEQIFRREKVSPHLILDLACGTGSLIERMAARGYEMIGVDGSEEMLMMAREKEYSGIPPMFLHQSMEELDLFGTIDACVCCLDSVNYVTDKEMLRRIFDRVEMFLEPYGLFVFDVNTPYKFHQMDGQSYVREDADIFCVWQAEVEENLCTYYFDLFEADEEKDVWYRQQEEHQERLYEPEELKKLLEEVGFHDIRIYPELSLGEVTGQENRLFFTARKGEYGR